MKGSLTRKSASGLAAVSIAVLFAVNFHLTTKKSFLRGSSSEYIRTLSINLGNGQCEWTKGVHVDQNRPVFSTVLTGYPGVGKRIGFMQEEALTGLTTGDDFNLSPEHSDRQFAFMKTSYPRHEGIWSWGDAMDQSIMMVRNPRWAIPDYHHMLHEIQYAKDWETAYENLAHVYTYRPPMQDWERWRALRAYAEIHWYGWFIDFWMEGGILRDIFSHELTVPQHFEKLLQPTVYTYEELLESAKEWPTNETHYDYHCTVDMPNDSCKPVTIISYERLMGPLSGPIETRKIAGALKNKEGVEVISDETHSCIWEELIVRDKGLRDMRHRNGHGPVEEQYKFTYQEMENIIHELERLVEKYSSQAWAGNTVAQELAVLLQEYLAENQAELAQMPYTPPVEPLGPNTPELWTGRNS